MYGIIYRATNTINGKVYIGQTVRRLEDRKNQHIRKSVSPGNDFHAAIQKYGPSAFTWEEIDSAENVKELNEREIYWIAFYNSINKEKGYNSYLGGSGDSSLAQKGRKLSEEHKRKIADGAKIGQRKRFEQHNREKAIRLEQERKQKEAARALAESLKPPKKTKEEMVELTRLINIERWANPEFREHMRTIAKQNMGKEQKEKMRITRQENAKAGSRARNDGKLTIDDVKKIKRLIADGVPCSRIAERYGLNASYIRYIRAGKRWGWVA
jgi:group I intron endonuclease